MPWPIPNCTPYSWPADISSRRFARGIADRPENCRVALLGMPDDLGVRLNSGRPGAAQGPRAFREALAKYGVAAPEGFDYPRVFDAGDVVAAEGDDAPALTETHRRVTGAVRAIVAMGMLPVGIGGGHDLTYAFVRGVVQEERARSAHARFEGVYFDAHLDVREEVGSGMPFRRLVEDCNVSALHVIGLSALVNSREHTEWFDAHGGQRGAGAVFPPAAGADSRRFVSLDLDVLDASAAPGVSAMNPAGLSTREVESMVLAAGRCPSVVCFDIMELSPPHDAQERTARVAAHMFLTFLRGLAHRERPGAFNASRYA